MGVYRLELAKTGRAGCNNTECKKEGVKIGKGELRFGSQYTIDERTAWSWKHWGCVTPKQIRNLEETIEGTLDFLDGYDEIDEDSQAKVRKALEDGHVADDEWKGDAEMNRDGANSYRSPATKKAKRDAQKAEEAENADADADADANGTTSPSQPAPKKRGRGKADDDEEAPAKKKSKAVSQKAQKSKKGVDVESPLDPVGSDNEALTESIPTVKKTSTRRKKTPAAKENGERLNPKGDTNGKGSSGKKGLPRKAKSRANIVDEESDAQKSVDSPDETLEEPVRPRRGRKPKSTD